MAKLFLILIATLLSFSVFSQKKEEILSILDRQVGYWNKGDIDNFMEDYWKSPELMFIGKNGVTNGWEETKDRYYKSYPDRASMGTLKFDIKEVEFLNKKTVWVLGQWNLTRPEKGDIAGHYTLIFKKIKGRWLIVSDHSS